MNHSIDIQLYQIFHLKYHKWHFFPQRTKVKAKESHFPGFTYHLGFFLFETNLFQRLYIQNASTRYIYKKQIHKRDFWTWWSNSSYSMTICDKKDMNKSCLRDTEKYYLRFLSANRWQRLCCGENRRLFTCWPVIELIGEGTLHLLPPVAQRLWIPEQQFHWIWGFSEWWIVDACNLSRRWGYLWLQLT